MRMTNQPDQTVEKWQGVAKEKFLSMLPTGCYSEVSITDETYPEYRNDTDTALSVLDQLIADVVEDVRRETDEKWIEFAGTAENKDVREAWAKGAQEGQRHTKEMYESAIQNFLNRKDTPSED
jgi:hypothetical protein